jgi:hypothetical protein
VISDSPESNGNDSDDKNVSGSNVANGLDKDNGSGDRSSDPEDTILISISVIFMWEEKVHPAPTAAEVM